MFEPVPRLVRTSIALLSALCVVAAPIVADAQAPFLHVSTDEPKYTAIVMDARTGEVLYAKRADSPRYPASITKIMTLYLAFEALAAGRLRLTDRILVSPHAAAQAPTKLGLRAGETIDVEDAMHAIAVKSANDMAVALAERIGGTESHFAAEMTQKARELGMMNTQFVNANGLPDSRQISSARDIAILSRAVLRDYPQYYGFFGQEKFTWRGQTMNNHNGLLGRVPGVDGLKTGFTNAAGFNLAASAMRNGNRLIAVEMGGSSGASRNANVEGLLLTGFDVMQRRARGERLLAAQTYFEGAPSAPFVTGKTQIGQGDADADPIDAVLTRPSARPAAIPVSNSASIAKAAQHESRSWWVQVGEFKSRRQAKSQIEDVSRRFSRIFDDAEGAVAGGGRIYQARFSGFSEVAAKEACSTVRSRKIPCVVGGPV